MNDTESKRWVRMFKALGNPHRLRLFVEILAARKTSFEEGPACLLTSIMGKLKVGAPTVSHHLKELVNAGLISTELQGRFLACSVEEDALRELAEFFSRRLQSS